MNAELVHIPENNPKISIRFILNLPYQFIQKVGKAFMECKRAAVLLLTVKEPMRLRRRSDALQFNKIR